MKGACRSQQTILGSQFSPSAMWVLGIELRSSGLVEGAVTPGPLFLRQDLSLNPELSKMIRLAGHLSSPKMINFENVVFKSISLKLLITAGSSYE